jgi:hypothetical protein
MVLFQELVLAATPIDIAVFIDGLNDSYGKHSRGEPHLTARLEELLESDIAFTGGLNLPVARLAQSIRRRLSRSTETAHLPVDPAQCVRGYRATQSMIRSVAQAYGIDPVFVWQPVPMYEFDPSTYSFAPNGFGGGQAVRAVYELMQEEVAETDVQNDFLWCPNLYEQTEPPFYIDQVHYRPNMNRTIAESISVAIAERGLLPS